MDRIRIIFADDQKLIREGLWQLLGQQQDMNVVGEANDGVMAVDMTLAMKPDVLLLDLTMPKMSGIEVLNRLRESAPDTRVVVFTMNQNREYLSLAFHGGAVGYVLKGGSADQLLAAIRAAYNGKHYLSPSLWSVEMTELLNNSDLEMPAAGN